MIATEFLLLAFLAFTSTASQPYGPGQKKKGEAVYSVKPSDSFIERSGDIRKANSFMSSLHNTTLHVKIAPNIATPHVNNITPQVETAALHLNNARSHVETGTSHVQIATSRAKNSTSLVDNTPAHLDTASSDTTITESNVLFPAAHEKTLKFLTNGETEVHWSQTGEVKNKPLLQTINSKQIPNIDTMQTTRLSQRSHQEHRRIRRATSKFTGLIVGASRDKKLLDTVTKTLNNVEGLIWSLQSQYSKPFIASKHEPAMLLGTFSSDFRTNFHGDKAAVDLRRSSMYSITDLNSLTTLLILQCLAEASLYGVFTSSAASNMSIAIESLKTFHTHTYSRGSSIVTLWPEKLLSDPQLWVSRPENIIGTPVKDGTTFSQLQNLAKTCGCESAKTGLQRVTMNKLCQDYYSTPVSGLYTDEATPPNFLTSFSNLALGSLLVSKFPGRTRSIHKAESELWLSANSDVQILINKLKALAIIFPGNHSEVSINTATNITSNTLSADRNVTKRLVKREAATQNSTMNSLQTAIEKSSLQLVGEDANTTQDVTVNASSASSAGQKAQNNATATKESTPESSKFQIVEKSSTNTSESTSESFLPESSQEKPVNGSSGNIPEATKPEYIVANESLISDKTQTTDASTDNPLESQSLSSSSTPSTTSDTNVNTTTTAPVVPPTTSAPGGAAVTNTTSAPIADSKKVNASDTGKVEPHVNQILSSESYYAIRNYLDAVLPGGKEDVILIPSFVSDSGNSSGKRTVSVKNDGDVWHNGKLYHRYNSVNLLTTATVVHGLIVSSMAGLTNLQGDAQLQEIIVSSLRMLTWFMSNQQEVITMVTLSEFPSRYQLYWTTSRIAFQLNSRQAQNSRMFQFADAVVPAFVQALRDKMTFSILQSIVDDGLGQDGKTRVYIDDFIGVADLNDKGNKLVSGDDRTFTSAMAINILIAAWTIQQENGILEFVKDIGDPVRIAVNSLANYISGAVTDPAKPNLNAFMSEQTKNCETLPARYPANIITSTEGKELNPSTPQLNYRFGVKGYIPKAEYQKLLTNAKFGFTTRGGSLEDLNSPTSVFRFWSSAAYTKAVALLAIAQAANLQVDTVS